MSNSSKNIKSTAHSDSFDDIGKTFSSNIDSPYPIFKKMRHENPVMHGDILEKFGIPSRASAADGSRPVVSLFKYRDIMHVLRNPAIFTSGLLLEGLGTFLGRIITGMDGNEHRRTRTLLQPVFSPSAMKEWDSTIIRPTLDSMLDQLAQRGSADLLHDFALHFPLRIIYSILGLPKDQVDIEQFSTWALAILAGPQVDPVKAAETRRTAFKAAQDLYDHVLPVVAARRAAGSEGADMIGQLLRAQTDGKGLDDSEIASFIRMLLPAAAETTTRSFANMLVLTLRDPALMAKVRADRSLIPALINETMRFETPIVFLARQAAVDTEIGGVAIPAGTGISLITGSGNRDEDVFDRADEFDLTRKATPAFGFGYGVHMCIGMVVAKMEMECALNALLDRFATLEFDGPVPAITGAHFRSPTSLPVRWS